MSKSILAVACVIAATVMFGYLGAAMLDAEAGRKVLAAIAMTIALTTLVEVAYIVVNRLRRRAP